MLKYWNMYVCMYVIWFWIVLFMDQLHILHNHRPMFACWLPATGWNGLSPFFRMTLLFATSRWYQGFGCGQLDLHIVTWDTPEMFCFWFIALVPLFFAFVIIVGDGFQLSLHFYTTVRQVHLSHNFNYINLNNLYFVLLVHFHSMQCVIE